MSVQWQENKKIILAILLFFFTLFIYTKLAGPIPFLINSYVTSKNDLFQSLGQGSVSQAPDLATISFGVTKRSSTVSDAQNQTNKAIDSVLENLKNLGVSEKDLKTTNYSVNPNYNFEGIQRITGYTVTQNIDLKIKDIKNTNRLIDAITGNGGNLIGQVQFGFDDKTKAKLENKARKEAVGNAKEKAQILASAAGVRLGKIINVVSSTNNPPFYPLSASDKGEVLDQEPTNITPGENTINVGVTIYYETY